MKKATINYLVDCVLFLSFLITAITGLIIFFFMPRGVSQGRYQELFFSKWSWALVHEWAGIVMIVMIVIHFILHFSWMLGMTQKMVKNLKG